MELRELLSGTSKAQLQGYYLHWFPGREVLSVRERLFAELHEAMTDHLKVRQRFDTLPRAQQSFIVSLLMRNGYSGTVEEVRSLNHGRAIEDFEIENVLKSLQESGYITRLSGTGGYSREVFGIPGELADALKRTVVVEERRPLEMLSLRARGSSENGNGAGAASITLPAKVAERMESLEDPDLRRLARLALLEHGGILTRTEASQASILPEAAEGQPAGFRLHRPEWRRALEEADLGTTGILSLRRYGVELEEEGIFIYQEIVEVSTFANALEGPAENDREVSLGADLVIDLDRAIEVLRTEPLEVTREGNIYKKIEEKIAGKFVTSGHQEVHDGSPVHQILELSRRLQFFEEEDQRIVLDPLRRRTWRKKPLLAKVEQVFKLFLNEKRGQRWSFHQTAIREVFLEHLRRAPPGRWLIARPFLDAVISRYLLLLDERGVEADFHDRLTGDFRNETLVVPLQKLHHDLSYWVLHRLALLGIIDVGYRDGAFYSLKLANLGRRLFEAAGEVLSAPQPAGGAAEPEAARAGAPRVLVNPDFEILIYPEAPEEASWTASLFADRLDSEHVKRYRVTRESIKRGIIAGMTREEILAFLESNAHGSLPPNVLFSVKEWTDGVEVVRQQKVLLLRAHSPAGADRLVLLLEARDVPYERLNETTVMVRGGKNERQVKELQALFQDHGLFVE